MIVNIKEIRQRIKDLRKLKNQTQVGTPARREILKKIREEKSKLEQSVSLTPNKEAMIKKILALKPHLKVIGVDLEKFSEDQLSKHLNKIQVRHDELVDDEKEE